MKFRPLARLIFFFETEKSTWLACPERSIFLKKSTLKGYKKKEEPSLKSSLISFSAWSRSDLGSRKFIAETVLVCEHTKTSAENYFFKVFSEDTVSLCLPFALLALKTLLPLAVAILSLKPCLFFLFLLEGWNVLFMIEYRYLIAPLTFLFGIDPKKDCKDMYHFLKYKSDFYICFETQ